MNIYQQGVVACIGPRCENDELIDALIQCYREARGCAYMTGFREFAGNTNTACLQEKIERVDALLTTKDR